MANYFEVIQTVTVGSGGSSTIVFTSIPQTYTDLRIFVSGRNSATDAFFFVRPNGSTSNLSSKDVRGTGSAASSNNDSSIFFAMTRSDATASVFGSADIYISNYTVAVNKSISIESVGENNATAATQTLISGRWADSAAITSMTLIAGSGGNFTEHSTATLYGIKSS